jgi:dTMP kinase
VSRGRFIVFEGGEGCGKSTQAALLAERLDALLTREPGATAVGAKLRELVLSMGTEGLDDRAEALIMAADRAQHVTEVVEPALESGRHVVCDRYIGSSVAYQGYGRGLDPDMVRAVSGWAAGGLWPDLVVLLLVPDAVARGRIGTARDRIEAAGEEFHRRVIDGFREQAADEPEHWVEVDGTGTPEEVGERVLDAVADVLGLS